MTHLSYSIYFKFTWIKFISWIKFQIKMKLTFKTFLNPDKEFMLLKRNMMQDFFTNPWIKNYHILAKVFCHRRLLFYNHDDPMPCQNVINSRPFVRSNMVFQRIRPTWKPYLQKTTCSHLFKNSFRQWIIVFTTYHFRPPRVENTV